jgi:hypothetical protein
LCQAANAHELALYFGDDLVLARAENIHLKNLGFLMDLLHLELLASSEQFVLSFRCGLGEVDALQQVGKIKRLGIALEQRERRPDGQRFVQRFGLLESEQRRDRKRPRAVENHDALARAICIRLVR